MARAREDIQDDERYIIEPINSFIGYGQSGDRHSGYRYDKLIEGRIPPTIEFVGKAELFSSYEEAVQFSNSHTTDTFRTFETGQDIFIYQPNPRILEIPLNGFIRFSVTSQTYKFIRDGVEIRNIPIKIYIYQPIIGQYRPFTILSGSKNTPIPYIFPKLRNITEREPLIEQLKNINPTVRDIIEEYEPQFNQRITNLMSDENLFLKDRNESPHQFKDEITQQKFSHELKIGGTAIERYQYLTSRDVDKIITFNPVQINRNIIKKLTKDYAELLSRTVDSFRPVDQLDNLKKRIKLEIILNFVNDNLDKRIPFRGLTPEIFGNKENTGIIDVPNYAGDIFKVEVYIYDSEYTRKLELNYDYKNYFKAFEKYTPTKKIVCAVENTYGINVDGSLGVLVKPPGGSVEFTSEINAITLQSETPEEQLKSIIKLITNSAKNEVSEEADIELDFSNINTTGTTGENILINLGGIPVNLNTPDIFGGDVTIRGNTSQIKKRFICKPNITTRYERKNKTETETETKTEIEKIIKKTWCFFIPLNTVEYNDIKARNIRRFGDFLRFKPVGNEIIDPAEPKYEEKIQLYMQKYLKYKNKYVELKKKYKL